MYTIKKAILFSMAMVLAIAGSAWGIQSSITAGDITGGKKASHINIAIFHKLHGQESFVYPKSIAGSDILKAMKGKAQFISLNHTSGLVDGDIITLTNDILREGANDSFEDFGVDCQLSVHLDAYNAVLSGICQILMVDQDSRQIEHKAVVKPTTLQADHDWVLLYNDVEDGIAIYANNEVGTE